MVHRDTGQEWRSRFDVVRDMHLATDKVRYTDLLLDLWSDASGAEWEDEDEVAAAARTGLLTALDLERIDRSRDLLARRHRAVVSEVRQLLGLPETASVRRTD
jgi:predicted RNA-binding protein associated with RNAse of E/G family